MTAYRVQHWPDMRGDGGNGDTIIFSSDWPPGAWERQKSWDSAWMYLEGNCQPGDTVEVLPEMAGLRDDSYDGPP